MGVGERTGWDTGDRHRRTVPNGPLLQLSHVDDVVEFLAAIGHGVFRLHHLRVNGGLPQGEADGGARQDLRALQQPTAQLDRIGVDRHRLEAVFPRLGAQLLKIRTGGKCLQVCVVDHRGNRFDCDFHPQIPSSYAVDTGICLCMLLFAFIESIIIARVCVVNAFI